MAEFTVTHRGVVYPWQCDHMGHMNVMWYVGKFDEASWQILSMVGLTSSYLRSQGVGMAAVEQRIAYKREVRSGTPITIRSAVVDITGKSIRLLHEMRNDETGEVAATTLIVGVHFDTSTRKARPLPSDISERAACMIASGTEYWIIPQNRKRCETRSSDELELVETTS